MRSAIGKDASTSYSSAARQYGEAAAAKYGHHYGSKVVERNYDSYDDRMMWADEEMHLPPPESLYHYPARKQPMKTRTIDDIQFELYSMALNCYSPIPNIVYSFWKYWEKRGFNTEGQKRVLLTIYKQFCWEHIMMDPRYSFIDCEDIQCGNY